MKDQFPIEPRQTEAPEPTASTSSPSSSTTESEEGNLVPGKKIALEYATPPARPQLSLLERMFGFCVGLVAGCVMVGLTGLRTSDGRKAVNAPVVVIYFIGVVVAGIIVARVQRRRPLTTMRWLVLGLLTGGGLTCLMLGGCFAFQS